jgi:RNA polymerase sigma-70 factor (ECF subfamily)
VRKDRLDSVEPDDDELLRRCQEGDETALAALVRAYQTRILQLADRVLGNAVAADEATAQAFFKVWVHCGQWSRRASAGTWIYRVAMNAILDVRRGQTRWWQRWSTRAIGNPRDPRPGPAEEVVDVEESAHRAQRVRDALQCLSESDRALLHFYYFEERPLAEIEAILEVPQANLKMRLARARERLRNVWEKHEDEC